MNKYDVIIVGGGLGGLTAGALLAKKKKKVLLLEQHNVVGGCATTFKRNGFRVEAGLHEMDGFGPTDLKRKVFKKLGIFDKVEFIKLPEFYRYKKGKLDITIPADFKEAKRVLTSAFPHEKDGIKKYFKRIIALHRQSNRMPTKLWQFVLAAPFFPLLYWSVIVSFKETLGDFLDKIIKDEELKILLCANLQYYHDDPYSMSMLYYGVAQGGYYDGGAYFVKGGSQNLSNALATAITDNGGEVLTNKLVTGITLSENKVSGVTFKESKGDNKAINTALSDKVICNAAIPTAIESLLPKDATVNFSNYNKLKKSMSLISVFIGLKNRDSLGDENRYSTFYFDNDIKKIRDIHSAFKEDYSKRSFVFVDYGCEDESLGDGDKNLAVVCSTDYIDDWNDLDNENYLVKKKEIEKKFVRRLEKTYPGISKDIKYIETGTAKTVERYTLNPEGTPYGYAQIPSQAAILRPQVTSPIKGLYFASAWAFPGGGFTGAILSGKFCADKL